MGAHNNVHIPGESWPHFTWFAIEFFVVLAIAAFSSREITKIIAKDAEPIMQNWYFFGIIAAIVVIWYMGIRYGILRRKVLETRY
ncbi:MAG: hypothetical protein ACKO7N_06205 [Candidatus Nitrosotenuis sp.]